jgi:LemA protein
MNKATIRMAQLLLAILIGPVIGQIGLAQAPGARTIGKDEVFFSIARRIKQVSESPVSAIVTELDGLIEVTAIAAETDGRSLVTVREQTPASAAFPVKSTRMRFAPPAAGGNGKDWTWVEFEENRKFYPIDKLFPYVKDELSRRKQATTTKWNALIGTVGKQREAAFKAMETAKVVIKADPPVMANLTTLQVGLEQAIKDGDQEAIISVYQEIKQQAEAVTALAETYPDLKANDAYLRLIETYTESINQTTRAQKDYVQSVEAYNEILLRLPFTLVAYGLGFTRLEPRLEAE